MASGPLAFAAGHSGLPTFAQQGQVDWVAFGNTVWNITSATLQRFAAADIQPATYGAAIAFGCRVNLGTIGRRRVEQALQSLQGSPSYRSLIWFGFGYKSFIHTLSETQAGFNCMALCACIVEAHSLEIAGDILSELWKTCDFPEQYEPSQQQFTNLIEACEGSLATTSFGLTFENMVYLRNHVSGSSHSSDDSDHAHRRSNPCAKARNIALVLCALFDLTKNKAESITVIGDAECGFIGAIAQWLFDLEVYVVGTSDHIPQGKKPNVIIQYNLRSSTNSERPSPEIQSATYYLDSTDDYSSSMVEPDDKICELVMRVPWTTVLSRTFGISYDHLCEISYPFAQFLGSAARIYSAMALGEEDLGDLNRYRPQFKDYLDNCYGSGLVYAIIDTFPELSAIDNLTKMIQRAEGTSFKEAVASFQVSISLIKRHCACNYCGLNKAVGTAVHGGYCMLSLAYVILRIPVILGAVIRPSDLLPTISGLRSFAYVATRQYKATEELPALLGLTAQEPEAHLPIILFSGSEFEKYIVSTYTTAISYRGICCYSSLLKRLPGQPEEAGLYYVLPGRIQRGSHTYDIIQDHPESEEGKYMISRLDDLNRLNPDRPIGAARSDLKALLTVRPGAKILYFAYSVSLDFGQSFDTVALPDLRISPGYVADRIRRFSCLIPCTRGSGCPDDELIKVQECPRIRVPLSSDPGTGIETFSNIEGLKFELGLACTTSKPEEDGVDLCIALQMQAWGNANSTRVVIRRHECLPCTTKEILRLASDAAKHGHFSEMLPEMVFHIFNARGVGFCDTLSHSERPVDQIATASNNSRDDGEQERYSSNSLKQSRTMRSFFAKKANEPVGPFSMTGALSARQPG